MHRRLIPPFLVAGALLAASCAASEPAAIELVSVDPTPADSGTAPAVPDGPLDPTLVADLDLIFGAITQRVDLEALDRVAAAGDARVAWLLADMLRFTQPGTDLSDATFVAWQTVTGSEGNGPNSRWGNVTNHLIDWDLPAPPGYLNWKRQLFEVFEPGWSPFFDDEEAEIDWRWVSWGGVLIDDRPLDRVHLRCPESCIPALDDPALTDAAGGSWYPDDRVVFGVIVGDEAVAFPKNIMEIHEMVNTTIGGRRVAIPYCTLCGSAQAYITDDIAAGIEPLLGGIDAYEMRTSGLLNRSNKVMYEFHTRSVFDTFTGRAVTGPLREAGVALEPVTVRVATWAEWKAAHPNTQIVAEDGGIGRTYAEDPLGGRDDDGPIFPIGSADPRLPVQEPVIGVVLDDGVAVAFPAAAAKAAFAADLPVEIGGVALASDGAGFTARLTSGEESVATHEAFWFAWSQFHPSTLLWSP